MRAFLRTTGWFAAAGTGLVAYLLTLLSMTGVMR